MHQFVVLVALILAYLISSRRGRRTCRQQRRFSMIERIPDQRSNMSRLVGINDEVCRDQLRMDRISFTRLCELLGTSNLKLSQMIVPIQDGNVLRILMDPPVDGQKEEKLKTVKTRRVWTQKEEEALIKCLKEIIPQGWKVDNGFKVGYLRELEKGMNKIFPVTDLRPYPHIHSKLHVWKKDYSTIVSLLSKSGIGWDNTSKMIDVEQEDAWEAYKKDRATGEQAEDITEAVNNLYSTKENTPLETGSPFNGIASEIGDDGDNNSVYAEGDDTPRTAKRARKRQSFDGETSSIISCLGAFLENTDTHLGEIAQRIGYEQDAAMSRKEVFQIIDTIEGLSMQQKLRVSEYFVLSNERLELFLSLSESARGEYVKMVLAELK
ncbi:hypothetical protein ACS0TY_021274 [Phlomoides rotata]